MAVLTITKENFKTEIVESGKPVLLDFWASWCAPCMMQSPVVDAIAEEHPEIKVGKVNVDEQPELASAFAVQHSDACDNPGRDHQGDTGGTAFQGADT